jgi:hypothetical protein
VTELILAQLMWLDYDNPAKPIYLYINSSGTQVSVNRHCSKVASCIVSCGDLYKWPFFPLFLV